MTSCVLCYSVRAYGERHVCPDVRVCVLPAASHTLRMGGALLGSIEVPNLM